MTPARIFGVVIVAVPLVSALLLGLGWAVRRAFTRKNRDRSSK
jgi:hypothetical protein